MPSGERSRCAFMPMLSLEVVGFHQLLVFATIEFVRFTPPDLLILFGGTTSSNDVFQLCFEVECMDWILQHLMLPTNELF